MAELDPLEGVRVLIIEDETVVAMLLEQMLEELNCEVAGVEGQVSAAVDLARTTDADVAILDMNLAGQRVDPVAKVLVERKVPFIFASGYGEEGLTPEWRGRPVLSKPFRLEQLKEILESAVAAR